jgi:hypothetical protein
MKVETEDVVLIEARLAQMPERSQSSDEGRVGLRRIEAGREAHQRDGEQTSEQNRGDDGERMPSNSSRRAVSRRAFSR